VGKARAAIAAAILEKQRLDAPMKKARPVIETITGRT